MTLQEAREEVIKRGIELLEKDDSDKRLICPICRCGSDEGEKGLSSQDKIHFTCPLGCFSDADIIGIIGIKKAVSVVIYSRYEKEHLDISDYDKNFVIHDLYWRKV